MAPTLNSPANSGAKGSSRLTARDRRRARRARDEHISQHRVQSAKRALSKTMKESEADKRERRLNDLGRLLAAAGDHHLWIRAASLPEKEERTPGRPTMFPNAIMLLYGQSISVFGSAAEAHTWFADYRVWGLVVDEIRRSISPEIADKLPDTGPALHQWNHFQRKAKANGWLPALHEAQRDTGAQRALDMGMFDTDARFRITEPIRDLTVTFDGKVSTSPSKHAPGVEWVNRITGEIKTRKADPNTKSWPEAGEEGAQMEWGVKGTYAWARLPYYGTRLCLDVETMSPDDDDEAAAIGRITDGLLSRLPGIQTVVMDGIYRHVHIDPYMRKGLLVVNKPAKAPRNSQHSVKVGDRWEKSHHVETLEVPHGDGVCSHRIYGIGGAPYEEKVNDSGKKEFVPLGGRTKRVKAGEGKWNWYRVVTIDCRRCGGKRDHCIPLLAQSEDGTTFKRSEYLRQIPMTDDQFKRTYGFRPDAESGNKDIEEAWHLKRMPAWGWHNQSLRMLLHAGQVNADAWAVHLGRQHDHGLLDPQGAA